MNVLKQYPVLSSFSTNLLTILFRLLNIYILIIQLDTLQVLMFACPTVSEIPL